MKQHTTTKQHWKQAESAWVVVRCRENSGFDKFFAWNKITGDEGPIRETYDDAAKDIGD